MDLFFLCPGLISKVSWSNLPRDVEFSHRGAHRGRHGGAERTSCAKRANNERTTSAFAVRCSVRCGSVCGLSFGGIGSVRFGARFGVRWLSRWLRFGWRWLSRWLRFGLRLLPRWARFGWRLLPRWVPSLPMWTPTRAHSLTAPMCGGVPGGLVRARRGGRHPGDDGTPDTSLGGLALPTEGARRRRAVGAKPTRVGAGGTAAHGGRHTRTRTGYESAPPTPQPPRQCVFFWSADAHPIKDVNQHIPTRANSVWGGVRTRQAAAPPLASAAPPF